MNPIDFIFAIRLAIAQTEDAQHRIAYIGGFSDFVCSSLSFAVHVKNDVDESKASNVRKQTDKAYLIIRIDRIDFFVSVTRHTFQSNEKKLVDFLW